jgi:hypothetical protein
MPDLVYWVVKKKDISRQEFLDRGFYGLDIPSKARREMENWELLDLGACHYKALLLFL